MLVTSSHYSVGVGLGVFASLFMGFSLFLVRYDMLGLSMEPIGRTLKGKNVVRFAEFFLMLLGFFCAFMSCVFAPVTLVTSLCTIVLLTTCVLDWAVLRQSMSLVSRLGAVLIISAIAIMLLNSENTLSMTTDSMLAALLGAPFLSCSAILLLVDAAILLLLYAPSIRQRYAFLPVRCGRFIWSPFDVRLGDATRSVLMSIGVSTVALYVTIAFKCLAISVRGSVLYGAQIAQYTGTTLSPSETEFDPASTAVSWLLSVALLLVLAFCTVYFIRTHVHTEQSCESRRVSATAPTSSAQQHIDISSADSTRRRSADTETRTVDEHTSILRDGEERVVGRTTSSAVGQLEQRQSQPIVLPEAVEDESDSSLSLMASVYFVETQMLLLLFSYLIFDDWLGLDAVKVITRLSGCIILWLGVFLTSTFRSMPLDLKFQDVIRSHPPSMSNNLNVAEAEDLRVRVRIDSGPREHGRVDTLVRDDDIIPQIS